MFILQIGSLIAQTSCDIAVASLDGVITGLCIAVHLQQRGIGCIGEGFVAHPDDGTRFFLSAAANRCHRASQRLSLNKAECSRVFVQHFITEAFKITEESTLFFIENPPCAAVCPVGIGEIGRPYIACGTVFSQHLGSRTGGSTDLRIKHRMEAVDHVIMSVNTLIQPVAVAVAVYPVADIHAVSRTVFGMRRRCGQEENFGHILINHALQHAKIVAGCIGGEVFHTPVKLISAAPIGQADMASRTSDVFLCNHLEIGDIGGILIGGVVDAAGGLGELLPYHNAHFVTDTVEGFAFLERTAPDTNHRTAHILESADIEAVLLLCNRTVEGENRHPVDASDGNHSAVDDSVIGQTAFGRILGRGVGKAAETDTCAGFTELLSIRTDQNQLGFIERLFTEPVGIP